MNSFRIFAIPVLSAAAIVAATPANTEALDAEGYWLTENQMGIVHFAPCGEALCGHLVWVENPFDENGALKLDAREEPLCGVQLAGDLYPDGPGLWADGWVYNPRNGETYGLEIDVRSDTKLGILGYLLLPLLGSTQVWTRVADDRGGCPKES